MQRGARRGRAWRASRRRGRACEGWPRRRLPGWRRGGAPASQRRAYTNATQPPRKEILTTTRSQKKSRQPDCSFWGVHRAASLSLSLVGSRRTRRAQPVGGPRLPPVPPGATCPVREGNSWDPVVWVTPAQPPSVSRCAPRSRSPDRPYKILLAQVGTLSFAPTPRLVCPFYL